MKKPKIWFFTLLCDWKTLSRETRLSAIITTVSWLALGFLALFNKVDTRLDNVQMRTVACRVIGVIWLGTLALIVLVNLVYYLWAKFRKNRYL